MEPQVIRKCVMCRKPQLSLKYFPFPTNCKENPTGTKTDNIDKQNGTKLQLQLTRDKLPRLL